MGIIRASIDAIRGGLADSWLEVIEPALRPLHPRLLVNSPTN